MKKLLLIALFFLVQSGFSQSIEWPKDGMIFQRNNQNTTAVKFVFKNPSNITRIELRFQKYDIPNNDLLPDYINPTTGLPISGEWIVNTYGGQQKCQSMTLPVLGGYYRLEYRINNGTTQSIKFGVGEVLAIAGQSNAAGYAKVPNNSLPYNSEFVKINNEKKQWEGFDFGNDPGSPGSGTSDLTFSSFWGALGQDLTLALNVPIAFYQTAVSGTKVDNWLKSANNLATFNCPSGSQYPDGYPYNNLKAVLQTTSRKVGLRGILWQQGETDSRTICGTTNYDAILRNLTRKARIDLNGQIGDGSLPFDCPGCTQLAWVIAKASYFEGNVNSGTTDSQQRVIGDGKILYGDWTPTIGDQTPYMYLGPNSDLIDNSGRVSDNTHFNSTGLDSLKRMWYRALTNTWNGQNFFQSSTPYLNVLEVDNDISCEFSCYLNGEFKVQNVNHYPGYINFSFHAQNLKRASYVIKDASGNVVRSALIPFDFDNNYATISISPDLPNGSYQFGLIGAGPSYESCSDATPQYASFTVTRSRREDGSDNSCDNNGSFFVAANPTYNATTNQLNIQFNASNLYRANWTIKNASGVTVASGLYPSDPNQTIGSNNIFINVGSSLSSGTYTFGFSGNGATYTPNSCTGIADPVSFTVSGTTPTGKCPYQDANGTWKHWNPNDNQWHSGNCVAWDYNDQRCIFAHKSVLGNVYASFDSNPASNSALAQWQIDQFFHADVRNCFVYDRNARKAIPVEKEEPQILTDLKETDVVLSPNPNNGIFKVQIESLSAKEVTLIIVNQLGNRLTSRKVKLKTGKNVIDFKIKAIEGLYILNVIDGKTRITKQVAKNN
ncbi:MAG: sialate O-acetylesterase [Leadbetterella sp.]